MYWIRIRRIMIPVSEPDITAPGYSDMNENAPDEKRVCSICGEKREDDELIHISGNTFCIFCYQVLKEWATQIGYDRKTLIEHLDNILQDIVTEMQKEKKDAQ